jgi:hypothetical protein
MNPDLHDLIEKAKRELRLASGIPWTAEEQEDERRRHEMQQLTDFMVRTFGVDGAVLLRMDVVWHDGRGVIAMIADDTQFHLRKAEDKYVLFVFREETEQPLVEVPSKDPNLANRIFVAIGDEIDPLSSTGKEVSNA